MQLTPVNAEIRLFSLRTTIRMKYIPRNFSLSRVMAEIDSVMGPCLYNFINLPLEDRTNRIRGHAFINFKSSESACDFFRIFHMRSWTECPLKRPAETVWANEQGLNECIRAIIDQDHTSGGGIVPGRTIFVENVF